MNKEVPRFRRFMALILLGLLTACQTWVPTATSPQALILEEQPSSMRITRTNGVVVTIKDPTARNDSIVSRDNGVNGLASVVGVPTADIGALEVRRFSRGRTVAFVVGAVVVALGWAQAAGGSSGGTPTDPGTLPKGPS